ncbi:Trehalose-6-P synthase/phosphatase complex synthase subunit [Sarracenia purpurea var. burkii]
MHHPSALGMFEQIINASKGKQIVMFLDYDGTLSPIVEDLDRAFMTHEVCLFVCFLFVNILPDRMQLSLLSLI